MDTYQPKKLTPPPVNQNKKQKLPPMTWEYVQRWIERNNIERRQRKKMEESDAMRECNSDGSNNSTTATCITEATCGTNNGDVSPKTRVINRLL